MSETATEATTTADESTVDETTTDATSTEETTEGQEAKDWQAEFKAQQKINRSLERKAKRSYEEVRQEVETKLREEFAKSPKGDEADKPDPEKIREEARREARQEALRDRVLDRIEAKAATGFQFPTDAVAHLRARIEEFIDGDKIDEVSIKDALDDLLTERPNWAAQGGKRFSGTADGGTRKETRPSQLTRADLARMSPEAIEDARVKGQLDDLMTGKSS